MRPHLLKLFAMHFDAHAEQMPRGLLELVDRVTIFVCGHSRYHPDQLHLGEFAALEVKNWTPL